MAIELISFPPIPSWHVIPGGLSVGKMTEIRGTIPYGSDIFQINFTAGVDSENVKVDRLLHLSIRFYEKEVVRNSFLSGIWGPEEKDGNIPFVTGRPFIMLILVEQNSYRIAVDGKHQWEFYHRLNFSYASHLFIDGPVKIEEIRFYDKFNQPQVEPWGPQTGTCLPPPSEMRISTNKIFNNPPVPFIQHFPGGLIPGMLISISGKPFASAYRFNLNLQAGSMTYPLPDIGFHMDVRFHDSTIVRNTRVSESWDTEETHTPYFPFAQSKNFDIILKVEGDRILVSVDSRSLFEFKHRIFPYSKFDTLTIESDVILSLVKFEFY